MSMLPSTYTARVRSAVAVASRPHWSSATAKAVAGVLVFAALVCAARPAAAQFTQQGQKLVGTGAAGGAEQGTSVALSADGNTVLWGGPMDNSNAGAAWLFSQSGGVWSQQGAKQVGAGAVGAASQGWSVALSADGNTAILGGPGDNAGAGAMWVFTLAGNVKLIGSGGVGFPNQGTSVALSADGNTAIEGGPFDSSNAGAAWVFTRSGGVWTAGGTKLPLGTGAVGTAEQGFSVALSADGNTAIVGGSNDNLSTGAVWIFTRSGSTWTQQGSKLVGSGSIGAAYQGYWVALSADGNTAIVGGPADNANAGAVWVFTRNSGGVWTQQGQKLVGSGAVGAAYQGYSVALSADGDTAIVGGPGDNTQAGAVWVFARSGGGVWTQQGPKLFGTGAVGSAVYQGYSVALSADGTTAIEGGTGDNSNAGAAWVFTSSSHIAELLSATPTSGAAPLAVTFRAHGLPLPMTYTIDFGDGISGALSQGSCFGSRSGVQCSGSAAHTYAAGTYYATLVNASGSTLGAATIAAGGNLLRPLQPPHAPRGAPPLPSPPVAISTPPPERHSLDR